MSTAHFHSPPHLLVLFTPGIQKTLHFWPLAASLVLPEDCLRLAITAYLVDRAPIPVLWTLTVTLEWLLILMRTPTTRLPADLLLVTTPTHLHIPIKIQLITVTRATLPQVITTPHRLQITAQTHYPEAHLTANTHLILVQVIIRLQSGTKIVETRPTMNLERNSGRGTVEEWRRHQGEMRDTEEDRRRWNEFDPLFRPAL
jgi:hypothetical protein